MRFGPSSEQEMLQDSLRRYLSEHASLARARRFAAEKETRAGDVVAGLAALGATGILVPEEHGGAGLKLLDAALAAETLGQHVAPAPFLGSSVLATLAIARAGSAAQKEKWLPKIASGEAVAGAAISELTGARMNAGVTLRDGRLHGNALFVFDFDADVYVVADSARRFHLVERNAAGLTRTPLSTVDVTRPTGELKFDGVVGEELATNDAEGLARQMIDAGRIVCAADTLGAAQAMLDQAVAYAKQREQFGRQIGSFQAVKHMCAEMAAALEPCRSLVWYAAHAFDALPEEASLTACHAKAQLDEVGARIAKTATEVHGGMGFTDLVGLHYWFKRIGFNRQMLGGPYAAREDAARLQGLG